MARNKIPEEIKIVPINDLKDIAAATEQLNRLIDNYRETLDMYRKSQFIGEEKITNGIKSVLDHTEKAINAICLRLSEMLVFIKTSGIK